MPSSYYDVEEILDLAEKAPNVNKDLIEKLLNEPVITNGGLHLFERITYKESDSKEETHQAIEDMLTAEYGRQEDLSSEDAYIALQQLCDLLGKDSFEVRISW